MRPAQITVREDFRSRPLSTYAPEASRFVIQRLDVQIINEPAPLRRRTDLHPPAAIAAQTDPLRLERRYVRRLL